MRLVFSIGFVNSSPVQYLSLALMVPFDIVFVTINYPVIYTHFVIQTARIRIGFDEQDKEQARTIMIGKLWLVIRQLNSDKRIETIDLCDHTIGSGSLLTLGNALQERDEKEEHPGGPEALLLSGTKQSLADSNYLPHYITRNRTIKTLALAKNQIGDDAVSHWAHLLLHSNSIQERFLNRNRIGDRRATSLAKALKRNSTLRYLNLKSNRIEDEGAVAIAEALAHNRTVEEIDLSNNYISEGGMQAAFCASCFRESPSLVTLHQR